MKKMLVTIAGLGGLAAAVAGVQAADVGANPPSKCTQWQLSTDDNSACMLQWGAARTDADRLRVVQEFSTRRSGPAGSTTAPSDTDRIDGTSNPGSNTTLPSASGYSGASTSESASAIPGAGGTNRGGSGANGSSTGSTSGSAR